MSVANVVMIEFETSNDLERRGECYMNNGPFSYQEINVFVKTGDTSAFGIAAFPTDKSREIGGKLRDKLVDNSEMSFKIKEIVPLSWPMLFKFIDVLLNPPHSE